VKILENGEVKQMKKLCIILMLALVAGTSFGMVKFNAGMTYNMFADTRITGMNQTFSVSQTIGDMEASWLFETAPLTYTDETNAATVALSEQVNAIRMMKNLGAFSAGIELGSVSDLGLGVQAPLMGAVGAWTYQQAGKDITTSISASIGYRIVDVPDTFPGASGIAVQNLNALGISLLISIGF
jgi:hypothetical protein